ncbi:MAG: DMT family transporter [Pseudomonadota bacterium]
MNGRELFVLVGMCVAWGFHFVVIKVAVDEIPPLFYAAIRMTLVAILLAAFLRWRKGQMATVLLAGVCLGALNYAFMFSGLKFTTASAAAIALELYVPFATILSVIVFKEVVGWRRILGIVLAVAGVAIIAGSEPQDGDNKMLLGISLVAAGAMCEAIGAVLVKRANGFKPIELLAWFALTGAVVLWAFTGIFETGQGEAFAESNKFIVVAAIIYSAVAASIFGHTAYYWLIKRLPMSMVAPSNLLVTILAVAFGVLLLGDEFTVRMAIGCIMALIGVGIVLFRSSDIQQRKFAEPKT